MHSGYEYVKNIFSKDDFEHMTELAGIWFSGNTGRNTRLRNYIATMPGVTRTVYRGQQVDKIKETMYFATSTNYHTAAEFGGVHGTKMAGYNGKNCCLFIIHLVNVPAYYFEQDTSAYEQDLNGIINENEYLVLGGGDFWKNSECTEEGFLEVHPGMFECWYTSPINVVSPAPRAIATRNEETITRNNKITSNARSQNSERIVNSAIGYSIKEIYPLALGIQNSKRAAMQIMNIINFDLPQSGYDCRCKVDGLSKRFCILWDTKALGNFKRDSITNSIYMILTDKDVLLITGCSNGVIIESFATEFIGSTNPTDIIVMGDIEENKITISNKTMVQNSNKLEKVFSTYITQKVKPHISDTYNDEKTMNVALVYNNDYVKPRRAVFPEEDNDYYNNKYYKKLKPKNKFKNAAAERAYYDEIDKYDYVKDRSKYFAPMEPNGSRAVAVGPEVLNPEVLSSEQSSRAAFPPSELCSRAVESEILPSELCSRAVESEILPRETTFSDDSGSGSDYGFDYNTEFELPPTPPKPVKKQAPKKTNKKSQPSASCTDSTCVIAGGNTRNKAANKKRKTKRLRVF